MPTVRGALIGKPSPMRPPGPLAARVNAENSRVTNTTTPRSVELNHQETLTRRSITSRMQMPCNNDREAPDGGGGQIARAPKGLLCLRDRSSRGGMSRAEIMSYGNRTSKGHVCNGPAEGCGEGR